MVSATWSPTTSGASGPDCIGIVDINAETGRELGEILGASVRATVVASA